MSNKKKFGGKKVRLTPMNPIQTRRALRSIEELYEKGDPLVFTAAWRKKQVAHVLECSMAWGG